MNHVKSPWTVGGVLICCGYAISVAYVAILLCHSKMAIPRSNYIWESPQQTAAFLAKVNEEVALLRSGKTNDDRKKMTSLSFELYVTAIERRELPEVWNSAASVIDVRSNQQSSGTAVICGKAPRTVAHDFVPTESDNLTTISYRDCEISLDATESMAADRARSTVKSPQDAMLDLRNVHLIYRGGRFPPVAIVTCLECTVDIQLQGIPPPRGRSFIRGLLFADFSNFSIGIADHDPPTYEETQRMKNQPGVIRHPCLCSAI